MREREIHQITVVPAVSNLVKLHRAMEAIPTKHMDYSYSLVASQNLCMHYPLLPLVFKLQWLQVTLKTRFACMHIWTYLCLLECGKHLHVKLLYISKELLTTYPHTQLHPRLLVRRLRQNFICFQNAPEDVGFLVTIFDIIILSRMTMYGKYTDLNTRYSYQV